MSTSSDEGEVHNYAEVSKSSESGLARIVLGLRMERVPIVAVTLALRKRLGEPRKGDFCSQ